MPAPRLPVLLACVLCFVASATAGETVSDPRLGFRFTVPDGFVHVPEQVRGEVIHAFHSPDAEGHSVGTFILIRRLNYVLDREKIDPKEVTAQNPLATISTEQWKEFDVEVIRVPEQIEGKKLVTFNAQVPLKPNAIQVSVIGDADHEAESARHLRSVLGTLDGETNWLTRSERNRLIIDGGFRLAITIGVVVAIVMAFIYFARRMMRNNRPTGRHRYDDNDRPLR